MKYIYSLLFLLSFPNLLSAISSQIALVKPNGATTIHTTLQDAYAAASNGDYIYLPGGTFSFTGDSVAKKLTIFGAGFNSDSTQVTLTTIISAYNSLVITPNGSGCHFEGIEFNKPNTGYYGGESISILNCKLTNLMYFFNAIVKCSIIESLNSSGSISYCNSSLIENCLIGASSYGTAVLACNSSIFQNNIFHHHPYAISYFHSCQNSICKNSILEDINKMNNYSSSVIFYNNLVVGSPYTLPPNQFGTIFTPNISDIFQSSITDIVYNKSYNYQLNSTCIGKNAGLDGTDVGIFGGANPCNMGWVPSNPHIYYENVSSQTNSQGKLPVQIKVRSGN